MPSYSGKFQSPVNCAEEGQEDSSISNLNRLQNIQYMLRSLRIKIIRCPLISDSEQRIGEAGEYHVRLSASVMLVGPASQR